MSLIIPLVILAVVVLALVVLNIKKGDNSPDRQKPWIEGPMLFAALASVTLLFFVLLFYWIAILGTQF